MASGFTKWQCSAQQVAKNIVVNGTGMVKLSAAIDPRSADASAVDTTDSLIATFIGVFVDNSQRSMLIGPRFHSGWLTNRRAIIIWLEMNDVKSCLKVGQGLG